MSDGNHFEPSKPELSDKLTAELAQITAEKKYRQAKFAAEDSDITLKQLNEKVKDVEGFWAYVLSSHPQTGQLITSSSDHEALSYLTGIELKQDINDPRPYELIFHFKENPFFSNSTLSKKYTLPKDLAPIKDGKVTSETWEYDDTDLNSTGTKIDWKSDEKDLCKKHPREALDSENADDEDFEGDIGTFFWFFQEEGDQIGIGHVIRDDILPDAYDYFTGEAMDMPSDLDMDELDDDEEDDDDASVDLEDEEEQPTRKKQKK